MSKSIIIFVCLLTMLLSACNDAPYSDDVVVSLPLLEPKESGPKAKLLKQKITLESRGVEQQFISVLRIQHDKLKLVLLSPVGQQILYVEYNGKDLVQKSHPGIDISGSEVLATLQFALWPDESIRQAYQNNPNWLVEMSVMQRQLFDEHGVFIIVNYPDNSRDDNLIIENKRRNYRLHVQPLEQKSF